MRSQSKTNIYSFAFKKSLPVLFGYVFLGIAFGINMQQAGYNALWSLGTSITVFAGSAQFVLVSLLAGGASLITTAVMIFLINSRHIFYGLTFIEKFRSSGRYYPYMVFSLSDETYSVLCSIDEYPEGMNVNRANFLIALFDQSYWVIGSLLGGLIGQLIPFDFTGIDFSMTALFIVILVNQLRDVNKLIPAAIGIVSSVACIFIFGASNFILPSLIITVAVLLALRRVLAPKEAA